MPRTDPKEPETAAAAAVVAEEGRLSALRRFGVLDTAPERAFDELTVMAARLCGTPIALVSLVDADRQWFKARLGLELCQTSREWSFCAHALHGTEPLVVPDATRDSRFARNPLVTGEPGIRFYAGAPLITAAGHVLGTLCVLDVVARELTEDQLESLTVLARQVVSQLELRRQAEELATEVGARAAVAEALRESQRVLRAVLDHTDAVVYAKDLDGRYLLANPAHIRLLGRDAQDVLGRNDYDLFPALAADDYRRHDAQVAGTGRRTVFAEQAPDPDGTVHSYLSTKSPLVDDAGRVYAVAGVSTDVTELFAARSALVESEQRWKALVEHSPVAVAVIGADGCFAYANPPALALYGAQPGELLGRAAGGFLPADDTGEATALFSALLQGGPPVLGFRWTLRRDDGSCPVVDVNAAAVTYLSRPAVQVELRDVSAQAIAEAALRQSEQRFRALFACSPVGAAESLADGTLVAVNARLADMLGYRTQELIGRPASVLLADPVDATAPRGDLSAVGEPPESFTEREYRRKNGSCLSVLVGTAPVLDERGQVLRVLDTVIDISERVQARTALHAAHSELEARQAFSDAVLESINVGIVACDAEGHLTLFNDATRRWHGLDVTDQRQDALDTSRFAEAFSLHDPDGRLLTADQVPLTRALKTGAVREQEIVISPGDRPATRVLCTGRALSAPDGRLLGAVVAMTDITQSQAHTRALEASEQRFRTTFTNDPAGLVVLTASGRALQVNPAMCRLLGRSEGELLHLGDLMSLVMPDDRPALVGLTRQALDSAGESCTAEKQLLRSDGSPLWALLTATQLPDADSQRSLLLQVEDITARKDAEQSLTRQALHDALTDLPNRTMLLDRTSQALARLSRHPDGGLVAMLFLDLDGFKAVNDSHGHSAGDAMLVEVGRRLIQAMRPTDTVARLGGDEFVVLCEELTDDAEAPRIAQRLEEAVSSPVAWRDKLLRVTCSVGIAYGTTSLTPEELLRHADTAMYQAKRLGKDRYEVFDRDLHARSTNRVKVEAELRAALASDGIEVHYQPIVELPGRRIVAVEALARIGLPDGTLGTPDSFIPVSEETGLVVALGTHVLRAACAQLARWRTEIAPDLTIAVNLSARQAARPDLCDVVEAALADAGLPATALSLELTESVLLEAGRSTLGKLNELRRTGVEIGIDDFGTGYASLRYLRELPVTFLKVDRSFVAGMAEHHQDNVIVQTVIRLAADLGLGCVIEGVENEAQLAQVRDSGAQAQGYLLGRPGSADDLTGVLRERAWPRRASDVRSPSSGTWQR